MANEVHELVNIYSSFDHEVGGILFGKKDGGVIKIQALSFKHGGKYRIDFTDKDCRIFSPPKGMVILGTWHTHPFQKEPFSSSIDTAQWKKWNNDYVHMVVGEKYSKIYEVKKSFPTSKKIEEVYFEKRI
ncbi:MAG: Mov34/MPN/PAD-1 family protein [Enterococcaceae bacterium]|nr:Mov34/MPN/PAD-1 family protein [Enterococcaceae bacterium]